MKAFLFAMASATLVAATLTPAPAAVPNENLRGTVASATADSLVVKTATGPVTVHLGAKVAFAGAVAGTTADITPGKFLGIASVPGGTINRALEVVVFDDSMRGVGEGDYAWDLAAPQGHSAMTNGTMAGSHSTMTNGTVATGKPHSTMTNATVGAASGTAQKTITMNYKGGSRKLVVPANAPVVKIAPGTSALLVKGASVFVIATKTATPDAAFVVVAKDGVKLPM
jgi:hypothetical protein